MEIEIKKNNYGFTLAEVLITLAVIGVIAALTIPTLITSTNEAELRTKWKKNFSVLSQASKLIEANNGSIDFTNDNTMANSYSNIYNAIKTGEARNIFKNTYKFYKNGSSIGWNPSGDLRPSSVLADGTFLMFRSYGTAGGGLCKVSNGSLNNICGLVYIDINGEKGPNMYGKDLFSTWITNKNGNITPVAMGSENDGYSCSANSTDYETSEGCSAAALYKEVMP